ncbi:hypothetical protein Avi_9522 (plasmid) [Allorhizobium ampelinum S4]|uniref:Uncharacterized protein n=1 Tax=Allorhizobium ampelinum (strain ATCC BAA-846 / DSM 112012 / S4) TaxID=311402 RepID=B9K326_ALLAM|nr:hypothetical protein [Allorhizobium ampelinum]ACM39274.1 hypothetical protein Avi_9522 [Allorhizobium ampelinum S4]
MLRYALAFLCCISYPGVVLAEPLPFAEPPSFKQATPGTFSTTVATQNCEPVFNVDSSGNRHYQLEAKWTDPENSTIYNPNFEAVRHEPERDHLRLRSYNGCTVGPKIETEQGKTLFIDLENKLLGPDPSCIDPHHNEANCFNTINLISMATTGRRVLSCAKSETIPNSSLPTMSSSRSFLEGGSNTNS